MFYRLFVFGNFVVLKNVVHILADLGAGEYTAFTFDLNYRYKMIEHASFGHSVPIINGTYQKEGAEYAAKNVKASENSFSFDMEGAYEDGLLKKLHRSFELYDDRIVLRDTVEYSELTESITERFVSTIAPEIGDSYADIGRVRLIFDKERFTSRLTTDSYKERSGRDVTLYLLDVTPRKEKETEFKLEIQVK